jgi:hypothetical protein
MDGLQMPMLPDDWKHLYVTQASLAQFCWIQRINVLQKLRRSCMFRHSFCS